MTDNEKINTLRDYIVVQAECPCCGEFVTCADDCTLEEDLATDGGLQIECMKSAREILKITKDSGQIA